MAARQFDQGVLHASAMSSRSSSTSPSSGAGGATGYSTGSSGSDEASREEAQVARLCETFFSWPCRICTHTNPVLPMTTEMLAFTRAAAARLEAQRKIAIQREAYRRTAAEWARAKEAVEEAARATAARSAAAAAEAGVLAAGGAASDVEVEVNAVVRGVAVHAHAEAHVPAHSSSGGSGAGAGAGAGSGNTSSSSSSSAAPHVAATATVSPTLPIGFPALPPEPDWSALQSALPAVPAPPAMTPEVYAAQACQECGASYCDPAPTYLQAVTADGTVADGAVSAVPPRVPVHALSVLQVTLRNSTDDPAAYLEELGITPEYIESCLCNHHHQHTHEHGHGSSSGSGGAGAGEGEGAGSGSAAASAASPSEQVTMAHAVHHRDLRQQTLANGYAGFAPVLGVVYDERMLLHQDPRDAKPPRPSLSQSLAGVQLPPAASSPHPERPDRLRSIAQHLVATGLFQRCKRVAARDVAREEVLGVHEEGYAEAVDELPDKVAEHDGAFTFDRSDTYANPYTYQAAKLACGSVLAVTEAVLRGQLDRGVALVRPPGHHAEPDAAMGFCIYNNVAVAAAAARKKWGARRVLIVDWDVHHGESQMLPQQQPPALHPQLTLTATRLSLTLQATVLNQCFMMIRQCCSSQHIGTSTAASTPALATLTAWVTVQAQATTSMWRGTAVAMVMRST